MSFFSIVDIMFCCRDIFRQISKSVQKTGFCPQPVGRGKRSGNLNQIFRIAVISEYVSKFEILSVTSEIMRRKRKNHRVKYKPFGIVIPGGLITARNAMQPFVNISRTIFYYFHVRPTSIKPKACKLKPTKMQTVATGLTFGDHYVMEGNHISALESYRRRKRILIP